ncbi:MAG: leucine-rich repeat domain-containing protein, partial [Candidatus Sigynarchaeota archaeon]
ARDARVLEGTSVRKYLTPAEEVLAHASNLQAWVENNYDTRLLHSNIAFPLLKELARAGDEKAARVLDAEIEARLRDGNPKTCELILKTCGNVIRDPALFESLLNDKKTKYDAMAGLARLAREGNDEAARIIHYDLESRFQAMQVGVPSDFVCYYLDWFTEDHWLALVARKKELEVALYGVLTPRVIAKLSESQDEFVKEILEYRRSIGYLEHPPVVRIEGSYVPIIKGDLDMHESTFSQIETLGNEHLVIAITKDGEPAVDLTNLGRFSNLEYLNLQRCQLHSLPDLSGLKKLEEIEISDNYLRSVEQLACATNLRIIHANNNSIESLHGIENLIHLERASFIDNKITSLPNLSKLVKLKELSLNGNKIMKIDIDSLPPSLEVLELVCNPVSDDLDHIEYVRKELKKRNREILIEAYN